MSQKDSKPIKDFRCGPVQASAWRNEVHKNGRTVVRHSVRVQKQFRKEDGSYETTDYYFVDELPKLALVANKAYEFIALQEGKDAEVNAPV